MAIAVGLTELSRYQQHIKLTTRPRRVKHSGYVYARGNFLCSYKFLHIMSALTDALSRILNWLEENEDLDFARFESLQPGLTCEEIEEKVVNILPFRLPTEVYELYQWANGTWFGEEDGGSFFSARLFLSLDSAIETYAVFTGLLEVSRDKGYSKYSSLFFSRFLLTDKDTQKWINSKWNPHWFPVFQEIDNKGFLVIVLDEEQK